MQSFKKILYVSCLCSSKVIDHVFNTAINKPALSIQKFHRLLAEGFAMHSDSCRVKTISAVPVTSSSHRKCFWRFPREVVNGVEYSYVSLINLPVIKNIGIFVATFMKVFFGGLFACRKETVVICDVLNLSITAAALLACKLLRVKSIAIVTDVPDLLVGDAQKRTLKRKVFNRLVSLFMNNYDGYILLTEQMNERVNPYGRPYIIMEGLVDKNMQATPNTLDGKSPQRILIYAGGIYEQYGVETLIKAFMKLDEKDVRLHIYGCGAMEKDMPGYMQTDNRIVYHGMVPNAEVVQQELRATLLINPRPTIQELTKYSFPSKNMEYMVSGTPVLTTPLPGMPEEYKQFVYLFEDETVDGMAETVNRLLSKPRDQLHDFGIRAREFVLAHKSNEVQARRILTFLGEIL